MAASSAAWRWLNSIGEAAIAKASGLDAATQISDDFAFAVRGRTVGLGVARRDAGPGGGISLGTRQRVRPGRKDSPADLRGRGQRLRHGEHWFVFGHLLKHVGHAPFEVQAVVEDHVGSVQSLDIGGRCAVEVRIDSGPHQPDYVEPLAAKVAKDIGDGPGRANNVDCFLIDSIFREGLAGAASYMQKR